MRVIDFSLFCDVFKADVVVGEIFLEVEASKSACVALQP
jgi:hypothetical protein